MKNFRERFKEGVRILSEYEKDLLFTVPGAQKVHLLHVKHYDEATRRIKSDEIIIVVEVWKNSLSQARKSLPKEFHGFRVEARVHIPPPPKREKKRRKKY